MIYVQSPHPPGTVAVVTGELARYVDFEIGMDALQVPSGSAIVRIKGSSVSRNRNQIVEKYLHGEWVCFIDDDQIVPADTLLRLLSHGKPIVGALYSTKHVPFSPVALRAFDEKTRHYVPYQWREMKGLVPVRAAGTGGMLIRRSVFDLLGPPPWFHAQEFTDDIYFCNKAHDAGIEMYVDADARIGHTTTMNVWPDATHTGVHLEVDWLRIEIPDDGDVPPTAN